MKAGILAGMAAAAALMATGGPTVAQGVWGFDADGVAVRGTSVQALPTPYSHGGSCVRWCVADASPCDPDYYKVADRRCNINQNGYFPK